MPVRVGVPTALARELITKVVTGFVDQVTLELKNLKVKKSGNVKKVVSIGQYELQVRIHRVTGKLKTGTPELTFGGNQVKLALPVTVASGSGRATINFKWDGKNVSGAVCGDMEVTQEVSGGVKPANYPVSGGIVLTATTREILASPKFPLIKVNLKVQPSAESWAAVQKILDEKTGVCGYVVEKVNVLKIVQGLIDRGFNVRLPTEKIKPMAIPVGIEPTMQVRGQPVELAIKVGELAITEKMIWLGADVQRGDAGARGAAALSRGARQFSPFLTAKPTSSALERSDSVSIIRYLWYATVRVAMPSSAATSFIERPAARRFKTSRSREESRSAAPSARGGGGSDPGSPPAMCGDSVTSPRSAARSAASNSSGVESLSR